MAGIAGFAPFIVGIVFVVIGFAIGHYPRRGWVAVPGTQLPWVQGTPGTQHTFQTPDGVTREASVRLRSGLHSGQPVEVLYDPANPDRSVINTGAFNGSVLIFAGIALAAAGLVVGIVLTQVLR